MSGELTFADAATAEEFEYSRGTTRVGQTGWVAWLDHGRKIHCKTGKCVQIGRGGNPEIRIDGADPLVLTVPHGRLDYCANAALDSLAIDLRAESEMAMKPVQAQLAAIARTLLLDLVAVEMAKKKAGDQNPSRDNLEDGIKKIGHNG